MSVMSEDDLGDKIFDAVENYITINKSSEARSAVVIKTLTKTLGWYIGGHPKIERRALLHKMICQNLESMAESAAEFHAAHRDVKPAA